MLDNRTTTKAQVLLQSVDPSGNCQRLFLAQDYRACEQALASLPSCAEATDAQWEDLFKAQELVHYLDRLSRIV